jgi:hypothetical protein
MRIWLYKNLEKEITILTNFDLKEKNEVQHFQKE